MTLSPLKIQYWYSLKPMYKTHPELLLTSFFILVWAYCMLIVQIKTKVLVFITLGCGDGVRAGERRSILRVGALTSSDVSSSNSLISFREFALVEETNDVGAGDAGLSSFHCLPVRNFCGNFGLEKEQTFSSAVCHCMLYAFKG
jgi:hypothetical protein